MSANTKSIKKILIANRGEIASRIIRTCRILDIETVAVYSDVDINAPHTREANYREPIGGPMAYLSIDAIVQAALRSGADSVHPGYGFLSENPALPAALEKHGITFIGPSAQTITELGSKTNAKEIARQANAPVAPTLLLNSEDLDSHIERLKKFATEVGYPVIIKAAAGGGGRGMRVVSSDDQIRDSLESASRESLKAFGSEEIFVERFISRARHIEVQIAGDSHGNVVALGTRDCSLQRSNQKIIEEAPAVLLKAGVDEELRAAACRLAKQVGYTNLGTVEFLYSDDGLFYFLEVNTRLQVEHPVTEMVTGLDLVKLQIEIAQGANLREILGDFQTPEQNGHAIEARICAEEFNGAFVTTTGIILDLEIQRGPTGNGLVRADMGYEVCSEVSHYYDSLLGKLIVHAPDRQQALGLLRETLRNMRISGVGTNRSLLHHLVTRDTFIKLNHTVQGTKELLPSTAELIYEWTTAHAILAAIRTRKNLSSWSTKSPWGDNDKASSFGLSYPLTTAVHDCSIQSNSKVRDDGIVVGVIAPNEVEILIRIIRAESTSPSTNSYSLSIDRASPIKVTILEDGHRIWVHTPTSSVGLTLSTPKRGGSQHHATGGEFVLKSPIPGKVAAINTEVGAKVTAGDVLVVLDSMKMEHPFKAPRDGVVKTLPVSKGSLVSAGDVLVTID
jgi:acetyl/propionyl-CoA carboxylase alpha subunit